jgi:(p)ppGpp synthase/HD superfamily hydrolase
MVKENTMNLIQQAAHLATRAHEGQKRKYSGEPYIVHPAMVAARVEMLPGVSETEIAAAWLHDVPEDCAHEFAKELNDNFPPDVIRLVYELTNPSKGSKEPRRVRKQMDRDHLRNVSVWAKKIKLIDRICNWQDILKELNNVPGDFASMYCNESVLLLNEPLQGADAALEQELRILLSEPT